MKQVFLLCALAAILVACGGKATDPREQDVRRGVGFVKSLIDSTARNPAAALSLASLAEQGGTLTTFIAASLPDDAKLPCLEEGTAPKPFCIVIRPGANPGEYLIDGYSDDVSKPIVSEKAVASAPRPR